MDEPHYLQLRSIAQRLIAAESKRCTLTATGLVHELYLKMQRWSERQGTAIPGQFPYATRIMKQILIDRARSRIARDRAERTSLEPLNSTSYPLRDPSRAAYRLVALEHAILLLEQELPQMAELVRLHCLDDLSLEEAAGRLGISRATAYRHWAFCKAWIASHLLGQFPEEPASSPAPPRSPLHLQNETESYSGSHSSAESVGASPRDSV
ncbi:MAG: ECF-type sigma factor [Pirellulaceae bacterium]|jgi:RNA polymerase sigma factor (TIGR02999 family)